MEPSFTDQIEEDIVFGVYSPGSRLVEDRLQSRFGLTRYALREVLSELEQRGLVVKYRNRGVEVIEPTPDEIDGLYEIRDVLECRAAEVTPLPVGPECLGRLEKLITEHAAAAASGDLRQVFRLNIRLHREQYASCPNAMLRLAIEDYARKVHVVRAVTYTAPNQMERVTTQHNEILAALRGSDTARYVAAVKAHLPDSRIAYRKAWIVKHGADAKIPVTG